MVACALYPTSPEVTSFRDILDQTEQILCNAGVYCGHGYDSEHDEAVALVLAAAELPVTTGTEILDEPFPDPARERLKGFLERRTRDRVPTAYIIGRAWLGPLEFRCDPRALVPRSPLMAVIETGFAPWWTGDVPRRLVDVCCGGGSLGLLAAATLPGTEVYLTDIDSDALALAEENRALHGLTNVVLGQGDLLAALAPESVDIILANPPYVDALDMAALPDEYLHEPGRALAAGNDGLELVHRLLREAHTVLAPEGVLFLEVGNSWLALEEAYPVFAFTWLQFESGGHGVCVLNRSELSALLAGPSSVSQQL